VRRGVVVRSVVIVALGAGSVLCVGLAARSPSAPGPSAARALVTPVWSPRRDPQPVVDGVGAQRLDGQLTKAVAGTDSCAVVLDGGRVVVEHNGTRPLIPASTQKLLTAIAALQTLGPNYRYTTTVVAARPPAGGSVDRLWLVGSGDPGLATPEHAAALAKQPATKDNATTPLSKLADAIVATGITSIPGGISGDDSRYDVARTVASWPASYRSEVGPLGALTVDGGFDRARGVAVGDPALYTASELTRLLAARGVAVGPPGHASAPGSTVDVASVASPPLDQILAGALRASDNLTMELVARELGRRVEHTGTTAAGVTAVTAVDRQVGLPVDGVHLVDGSGLDRGNRATCTALLGALRQRGNAQFHAVADGLPVAGRSGTLATRFVGSPLQGKLAAKTGSLDGATGLVGTLDVTRPLEFAFVANGAFPEVTGIALREEVARILARFPDVASPEALVPGPTRPE